MCEFADEFERPLEGVKTMETVVADVEVSLTERTGILFNREYPLGEGGVGRPGKTHRSPSRNKRSGGGIVYPHNRPLA